MSQNKGGFFQVEELLDKRVEDGQLQYFVKWKGYPHADNTWEPVKELPDQCVAEFEKAELRKKKCPDREHEYVKYSEIIKSTISNKNEIKYLVRGVGKTQDTFFTENEIKSKYPLLLFAFYEKHLEWHEVPEGSL